MSFCEDYNEDRGKYSQCLLRKGNCEHRAWIPVGHAVVGKVLRIYFSEWENGWEVISVGKNRMTGDDLDTATETGMNTVRGWSERDRLIRQVTACADGRQAATRNSFR